MAQQLPPPGARGGPPDIPTSYTVDIRPTSPDFNGTGSNTGPSWFVRNGFTLRSLLSDLYDTPESRIDFDDNQFADERLDMTLNLPKAESDEAIRTRVIRALEERLRIEIQPVTRLDDVWAVTVADPAKLARAKNAHWGSGSHAVVGVSRMASTMGSFRVDDAVDPLNDHQEMQRLVNLEMERQRRTQGIALDSLSMDGDVAALCRTLENATHRPCVDHTNFHGALSLTIERGTLNRDEFFAKIEQQYGLAIRPATAEVEHLTVTHRH